MTVVILHCDHCQTAKQWNPKEEPIPFCQICGMAIRFTPPDSVLRLGQRVTSLLRHPVTALAALIYAGLVLWGDSDDWMLNTLLPSMVLALNGLAIIATIYGMAVLVPFACALILPIVERLSSRLVLVLAGWRRVVVAAMTTLARDLLAVLMRTRDLIRLVPWDLALLLLAAGVMAWAGLRRMPYAYYSILRPVVAVAALRGGWGAFKVKAGWAIWGFLLVLLLFNPLVPLKADREVWRVVDAVTGSWCLGVGGWLVWRTAQKDNR